ncbi:MAG: hypothetical protein WC783_04495 [Candidatus Paceibacterota bacterium]|jgi:hypothetical protein
MFDWIFKIIEVFVGLLFTISGGDQMVALVIVAMMLSFVASFAWELKQIAKFVREGKTVRVTRPVEPPADEEVTS